MVMLMVVMVMAMTANKVMIAVTTAIGMMVLMELSLCTTRRGK